MYKLINKTIVIFIIVIIILIVHMQLVTVNAANSVNEILQEGATFIVK